MAYSPPHELDQTKTGGVADDLSGFIDDAADKEANKILSVKLCTFLLLPLIQTSCDFPVPERDLFELLRDFFVTSHMLSNVYVH